jgi:hypothetical protein
MTPGLVEMLRQGHQGMSEAEMDAAMNAWFDWIEERRQTLKETDPQGLVALFNELHC